MDIVRREATQRFFSYRRHDLPGAKALLPALEAAGVGVFRDENAIDEGALLVAMRRAYRKLGAVDGRATIFETFLARTRI